MIRAYRPEDLPLLEPWWDVGTDTYHRPTARWSDHVLNSPDSICICEVEGDQIRGIAQCDLRGGTAYIGIAVNPEHRLKGIASMLFEAIEERAVRANAKVMSAFVNPKDEAILAFVQSRGMTSAGHEDGFVLYAKNIGS